MKRIRPLVNVAARASAHADFWIDGDDWFPAHAWAGAGLNLSFSALGLVRLRVRGDRVALLWNARSVDPDGLASALRFLERVAPSRRCDLRYLHGGWIDESYPAHETAIARVREIQQGASQLAFLPGISVQRRPLDELEQAHAALRDSLRILGGSQPMDWAATPTGRTGIVLQRSSEGLVFRHVGDRSEIRRCLGDGWWRSAVGRPVDDGFADGAFNASANRSYAVAEAEGQPLFETVLANVSEGPRRVILPFERLTVPLGDLLAVIVKFRNGPILAGPGERDRPAYLEVA
jgi:hypothetical protein